MKSLKYFLILSVILINLSVISAAVTGVSQTDKFYDSKTSQPVTGVQEILYTCSDSTCSSQGNLIKNANTGNSNSLTFNYPYNSNSNPNNLDYFSHFSFKQCYLPKEYVEGVWGYGTSLSYDYQFNKAKNCQSPIDSFSITNNNYPNEPVVINVVANSEADATSPFTDQQLNWFPAGYEDYYSAKTKVILEIYDSNNQLVFTDSKDLNILMDTSINVQFAWTPTTEGSYKAKIRTNVVDCQCENSIERFSEKQFVVFPASPKDECYTLINDLKAVPQFANKGDNLGITFDKISNYADNSHIKTPVSTNVTYEILKDNQVVFTDTKVLNANPDSVNTQEESFNWVATDSGFYSIKITGIANSNLCTGKTNPADIEILGITVAPLPPIPPVEEKHSVTFRVTDCISYGLLNNAEVNFDSQMKTTGQDGNAKFNDIKIENYNWSVSKTDYQSKTGTLNVNSDETINLCLSPVINPPESSVTNVSVIYPNGGENLSGIINVLWSAVNSKGHELVIEADYSKDNNLWNLISGNETNDGSLSWNTTKVSNGNYYLRVCAKDTTEGIVTCDNSNSVFKIFNQEVPKPHKTSTSSGGSLVQINSCEPKWSCSGWGDCADDISRRSCVDLNGCENPYNKPSEVIACSMIADNPVVIKSENMTSKFNITTILWILLIGSILVLLILVLLVIARARR
jgi:hypothetical protein